MSNAMIFADMKSDLKAIFNSQFVDKIFSKESISSNEIILNFLLNKRIGDIAAYFSLIIGNIEVYNGILKTDTSLSLANLQKIVISLKSFEPLFKYNFEPLVNLTKEFLKDQFHSNKEEVVTSIKERFIVDTETAISLFPDLIDKLTCGTIEILQIGTIIDFVKKQYNDQWIDCLVEIA